MQLYFLYHFAIFNLYVPNVNNLFMDIAIDFNLILLLLNVL